VHGVDDEAEGREEDADHDVLEGGVGVGREDGEVDLLLVGGVLDDLRGDVVVAALDGD